MIVGDFILKTNAARTLNASFLIEENQIAQRDILGKMHFLVIQEPAPARTMSHGQILKRTFAAFVTDRTVEGMRGQ